MSREGADIPGSLLAWTGKAESQAKPRVTWVDPPAWSFWWRGAMPTLALVLVALYAVTRFSSFHIEARIHERVVERLQRQGHGWVHAVHITGQAITLHGIPPTPEAAQAALATARATQCPTWAGTYPCVTGVASQWDSPSSQFSSLSPVGLASGAWPPLSVTRTTGGLRLDGEVPSEGLRQAILREAAAHLPPTQAITSELRVVATQVQPAWGPLVMRALAVAGQCERAKLEVNAEGLAFACEVAEADRPRLLALAADHLPQTTLGPGVVTTSEALARCETELQAARPPLVLHWYAADAAKLLPRHTPWLTKAAQRIAKCPARVRIEQHADTHTPKAAQLAEARVQAVRTALIARGLPPSSLLTRVVALAPNPRRRATWTEFHAHHVDD